jgi:hypothetical protein
MKKLPTSWILMLIASCALTHAGVRSGFWTLIEPGRDSIDLSDLTPLWSILSVCPAARESIS